MDCELKCNRNIESLKQEYETKQKQTIDEMNKKNEQLKSDYELNKTKMLDNIQKDRTSHDELLANLCKNIELMMNQAQLVVEKSRKRKRDDNEPDGRDSKKQKVK